MVWQKVKRQVSDLGRLAAGTIQKIKRFRGEDLGTYHTPAGQSVRLRFVNRNDAALLAEMFDRLSPESQRLRFHLYTSRLSREQLWQEATELCDADPHCSGAVVATVSEADGAEHAVGMARFVREMTDSREAEVSVVVRDDFQRRGLGKHLLMTLAKKARQVGITHFTAWVDTENIRLMKLIKDMELKNVEAEARHGQKKIRVPL